MVVYLVCFDLSATPQQQRDQIFFWLQFLHSSIPDLPQILPSTNNNNNNSNISDDKNWRVMVVGLKMDKKNETTFTSRSIHSWKSQMPNLPIFNQLFEVSSLHAQQSVQELLDSISLVCTQIFDNHTILIPSSFRKLLQSIHNMGSPSTPLYPNTSSSSQPPPSMSLQPTNSFLIHVEQLHQQLQAECDMDLPSFKYALRYLHAIGHIVYLRNELICTIPSMIPKLLAKFISPIEVQNLLLCNSNVQILNEEQIGFILQVNSTNDTRYSSTTFFVFYFLQCHFAGC